MNIKFSPQHKKIFQKLGIQSIYLFGSYAEGRPQALSDIDIGVVFSQPNKYKNNLMDAYSKLYDIFIEVLPKKYLKKRLSMRAHEFDLVFLQFAHLELCFNALSRGKLIFVSDRQKETEFRELIFKQYIDLAYFLKMRQKAILARI